MYKLVLVDDESDIREGLQEVVRFGELGFTVAGEAANGMEALRLCEKTEPDLVITDIRMPLMDGLTMCREIRKILPNTKFIILSGYDDFEYARQAIEFKTLGYVLKPINSTEFTAMLSDARRKLDEELAYRRDYSRLRRYFNDSQPLLREMFLCNLLSGWTSAETLRAEAARYQLDLDAPLYALAFIRPLGDGGDAELSADPELARLALMNLARETLGERVYLFHYNGLITALFLLPDEAALITVSGRLIELRKVAAYYLRTDMGAGISAPCRTLDELPGCVEQAASALAQSAVCDEERVLFVTDVEPGSRAESTANEVLLRALANALKLGDARQAHAALDRLMSECRPRTVSARLTADGGPATAPSKYRAYLMEVLMVFIRTARDMAVESALPGNVELLALFPMRAQSKRKLSELCDAMLAAIRSSRAGMGSRLSVDALEYIKRHYAESDLSVERLCRELHISPSYFSAVFKRETQKTFHQALTDLRMDRAMTLLATTNDKTAGVAAAIGIPDPSYFSYAFKRYFGMSPSEARRSGRSGKAEP